MLKRLQQIGMAAALKKLKHALFMDADTRSLCARNGAYDYLQRYAEAAHLHSTDYKAEPAAKIIWTCWLQGEENAPLLVKKCIDKMRKVATLYTIKVIDLNNINQFISLPQAIQTKYRHGIIPHAHFSDMVRLALLEKYGGVWIDSTIWLSDMLPAYVTEADLFVFRSETDQGHTLIYNPFIAAKPHHPILQSMLQLLYAYWTNEKHLVSYSIFHLFFTMAVKATALNRELWDQVPRVYGSQMFHLLPQLDKSFDKKAYNLATQLSSVHKLTYKFNQFGIDITKKGTFYDVLINGNKPC